MARRQDVFSAPWAEESLGVGPDFLFCMKPGKDFALVAPEYITGKVQGRRIGEMAWFCLVELRKRCPKDVGSFGWMTRMFSARLD